jgi:hypothetical protein
MLAITMGWFEIFVVVALGILLVALLLNRWHP